VDAYSDPSKTICKHSEDLCDSTILGPLIRAFKRVGVCPEASSLMNMSLRRIKGLLGGVLTVCLKGLRSGKEAMAFDYICGVL